MQYKINKKKKFDQTQWHKWYAWYPVIDNSRHIFVWLEVVNRRMLSERSDNVYSKIWIHRAVID